MLKTAPLSVLATCQWVRKPYRLVFPEDIDPEVGKISTASPIGRALMGKQEGDEVIVPLPDQRKEYEVTRIITIHDNLGENKK